MLTRVVQILQDDPRIAYALVFGSVATGRDHERSDLDLAIGFGHKPTLATRELGALIGRLESAAGRAVDLVVLDDAPPALAYRIFRAGSILFERDHLVLVERKARAILEYLDFRPIEELCTRGVLAAAARGR